MSAKRFYHLKDIARHNCLLVVMCMKCSHVAKFDPVTLAQFSKSGSSTSIEQIASRMVCDECGCRQVDWSCFPVDG